MAKPSKQQPRAMARTPASTPGPKPRLLTLTEASRELGMPYSSLHRLALAGELPTVRFGTSRYWIRRVDLERWLAAGTPMSA